MFYIDKETQLPQWFSDTRCTSATNWTKKSDKDGQTQDGEMISTDNLATPRRCKNKHLPGHTRSFRKDSQG